MYRTFRKVAPQKIELELCKHVLGYQLLFHIFIGAPHSIHRQPVLPYSSGFFMSEKIKV